MSRFADFPYFLLNDFLGGNTGAFSGNISTDNTLGGARLIGPETCFVTDVPKNLTEMYIKTNNGFDDTINISSRRYIPIGLKYNGRIPENDSILVYNIFGNKIIESTTGIITATGTGVSGAAVPTGFDYSSIVSTDINDYISGVSSDGYEYCRINYDYDITFYNYVDEADYVTDDGTTELYFRKDSVFCQWLTDTAPTYYKNLYGIDFDIRRYLNMDKDFIFFGYISRIQNTNNYTIEFRGYKDYAISCLPAHNRTPNLVELLSNFFDKQYHSNYHMLKDVWSMVDPYECDDKWLYYIGKYYGYDYATVNFFNRREFLSKIVYYLKRKGTYDSITSLYKILNRGNSNIVNIVEHWYKESDVSGTMIDNSVDSLKFLHTSAYPLPSGTITGNIPMTGMGGNWYYGNYDKRYYPVFDDTTRKFYSITGTTPEAVIRSTKYTIISDISNYPIGDDEIVPQAFSDGFVNSCNEIRPINRIDNHDYVMSILALNTTGVIYSGQYDKISSTGLTLSTVNINPTRAAIDLTVSSYTVSDLYKTYEVIHNTNTLYPYMKISYNNIDISSSDYIVDITDYNKLNLSFTNTKFIELFGSAIAEPEIDITISKGDLSGNTETKFIISECIDEIIGSGNEYALIGYINTSTNYHRKACHSDVYDYGDYNVLYTPTGTTGTTGTLADVIMIDTISTVTGITQEYNNASTGVLNSVSTAYTTYSFDITPSNISFIDNDIVLEEIRLIGDSGGDILIRLNHIHLPYKTRMQIVVKVFDNTASLLEYKILVKGG